MIRYRAGAALAALIAGLAVGLSNPSAAQAPADWATVKGQVVYDGNPPERKTLDVTKDQGHCLAKGPLLSEEWVVNKENKGVQWTFVWLMPNNPMAQMPIHPALAQIKNKDVSIDQPQCQFEPHALGLRQGQDLVAKNSSPAVHNVNWTGGLKNPGGNVIVPSKNSHTITDLKADRFPVTITCNIHPWMKAYARVYDHPYFAVTDANGKFEIKDAPVGQYRLVVWHEAIGFLGGAAGRNGQPIEIKKGGTTLEPIKIKAQ
jgi:hypothetical protein